jgi:HSP20 family protein
MMRFIDPFEDLDRMVERMGGRWRSGTMPMDIFENEGVYTMRFDLPGVDPDHVDLTVEGSMLTVTAERKWEDTEGVTWLFRERPTGSHSRQIRLGERLDPSGIAASYDHGVLSVTIPMREEAKPHKVAIDAGKAAKAIDVDSEG